METCYFLLVLLIVLFAFIFLEQKEAKRTEHLRQHGIKVSGVVVKNKFFLRHNSYFRPVIRFETQQGAIMELVDESATAFSFPRFAAGTKIIVYYAPENPRNFTATLFKER